MSSSSPGSIPKIWQGLHPLDWEAADHRLWQHYVRSKNLTETENLLVGKTFPMYAERCLKIKEKADPSNPNKPRQVIPLRMNGVQRRFFRGQTGLDVVLKSRKHGFSTLIDAQFLHDTLTTPHTTSLIVSNTQKSTVELMDAVKRMYDELPEFFKPKIKYNSKYEMSFPQINSKFIVTTAGEPESMRGGDITNLHCSEAAFWTEPEKLVATLFEAGPPRRIVIETTANGVGGWFYEFYQKAKAGRTRFQSHFYEWALDPMCRLPLGRGESIDPEPGLDAEQTKFIMSKRAEHGSRAPQEYPMNDVECFISTSRSVFDMGALESYMQVVMPPRKQGVFGQDGKVYLVKDGPLRIFAEPDKTHNYVIGADVSEGLDRGDGRTDYSTAVVIDCNTTDVVATWKDYIDPDLFADELRALGLYYGGVRGHALIGVENAFFGGTTLNALQKSLKYPWVYYQTTIDKRTNTRTDRLGWRTDAHSKPMMISELGRLIREGILGIPDQQIIEECRTFVRLSQTNGSIMGAESGTHDDMVCATAIACMMVINQPIHRPPAHIQKLTDPWKVAEEAKAAKQSYIGADDELDLDSYARYIGENDDE